MFHAHAWTGHASATDLALAALLPSRDVQFVDFHWGF